MPSFRTGTVTAILSEREGLQRVEVDGERAYVLTRLTGTVDTGDRVVINTTAVSLGLGTGGWHVVHWNLARDHWAEAGPGHIMKLRYTSLQSDTGAAEEGGALGDGLPSLHGIPVVACALHSQLPCAVVAAKAIRPEARIAFVMTDGGALPLALSDTVAELRERDLLDVTVTAGHAFGGDLEAVNLPSALHVAAGAGVDIVVVGTGPGVVGTGTRLGFSGLEVAGIVDAAGRGGGRPVVPLRYSDADPRPRHRGVSHHSTTALAYVHEPCVVPVPRGEPRPELAPPAEVVEVEVPDVPGLLAAAGLRVTSMGRGPDQDPRFYAYAGAGGAAAAGMLA